jgi:hypothetical protein
MAQANPSLSPKRAAESYSARQISHLAEDYLAQHGERLRAEAEQVIATSPLFAYLRINAQTEKPRISTTSTLQISGAK